MMAVERFFSVTGFNLFASAFPAGIKPFSGSRCTAIYSHVFARSSKYILTARWCRGCKIESVNQSSFGRKNIASVIVVIIIHIMARSKNFQTRIYKYLNWKEKPTCLFFFFSNKGWKLYYYILRTTFFLAKMNWNT